MLLPLLQEVRVAVLAFHNRAGILLVNSASSFKPPACHPYCLQQVCNSHGRVVAKSCAPGPGARERTVSRSGGAGVAAHELRGAGAGAGGRGRGPGADDQPSGRRTFPSVLNARSPGMKPPRNSRLFVLPRHRFLETINRQDSVTQAWTPEELAYAARVSDLYGRGVLPNCPAPTQCRISELWDDGVVARERRRYGWITIFQRRRASRSAFYYRGS